MIPVDGRCDQGRRLINMDEVQPARWMLTFWHSGGSYKDELDFPQVAFWHPDRQTARQEAARVLVELKEERGDEREWIAAGHPDPFEVGSGRHPGGQWILRYSDLSKNEAGPSPGRKMPKRTKSGSGAWKGLVDGEHMKQTLYEARQGSPNTGPT